MTSLSSVLMIPRLLYPLLFVCLFCTSCANQSLTGTWRNEALSDIKLEDVLVIGLVEHPETRKFFEKAFVEDLLAENIVAHPSYKVSERNLERTRESLLQLINKTDAKMVLVTHIARFKDSTTYQQSMASYRDPYGAFFGTRGSRSTVTSTTVFLESNIYDVKTEKLIWSAGVRVDDPKITRKYMTKITDVFIKGMKKDGII